MLEYFISTHGARKGLADTALRTADSGYLTRRLVDVAQDVIIRERGLRHQGVHRDRRCSRPTGDAERRARRPRSRREDVKTKRGRVLLEKGQEIDRARAGRDRRGVRGRAREGRADRRARSARCSSARRRRACARPATAARWPPATLAQIGDAVGIIAAQSIGEPGTQLTMRTFHTGGVAGADITHGLPRVVELFEARKPKGLAKIAEVGGDGRRSRTPTRRSPSSSPTTAARSTATRSRAARACSSSDGAEDRARARSSTRARCTRTSCSAIRGRTETELYLVQRGAGGLQVPGRGHQRQAHRADRAPDAQEGPGRPEGRHRPACRASSSTATSYARINARRQEGQGRAGPGRGDHPRHHQGVAGHGLVPVGGLLPGDHQGADRRGARGQDRPPQRAEGERDHRQADPGRHGAQALPADRDRAGRAAPARRSTTSACSRATTSPPSSGLDDGEGLQGFGRALEQDWPSSRRSARSPTSRRGSRRSPTPTPSSSDS